MLKRERGQILFCWIISSADELPWFSQRSSCVIDISYFPSENRHEKKLRESILRMEFAIMQLISPINIYQRRTSLDSFIGICTNIFGDKCLTFGLIGCICMDVNWLFLLLSDTNFDTSGQSKIAIYKLSSSIFDKNFFHHFLGSLHVHYNLRNGLRKRQW